MVNFNIDDFPDYEMVMVCENETEVKTFLKYLNEQGRCWNSGISYDKTNYRGGRIAYRFNEGTCCDVRRRIDSFYIYRGKALFFKDFLWGDENEYDCSFAVSISDIFK